MCNYLHSDSSSYPIPEEGKAWKIFRIVGEKHYTMVDSNYPYYQSKDGWIKWYDYPNNANLGFCGLPTLAEAQRLLNDWAIATNRFNNYYSIKEIFYKRGIGGHKESEIIGEKSYNVILFKEFRII